MFEDYIKLRTQYKDEFMVEVVDSIGKHMRIEHNSKFMHDVIDSLKKYNDNMGKLLKQQEKALNISL